MVVGESIGEAQWQGKNCAVNCGDLRPDVVFRRRENARERNQGKGQNKKKKKKVQCEDCVLSTADFTLLVQVHIDDGTNKLCYY